MLRIGIRYCGGCNPGYERLEAVGRLASLLCDRCVFVRHDRENIDGVLFLSGCARACAAGEGERYSAPSYGVQKEDDIERAAEWLLLLTSKSMISTAQQGRKS